MAAAEVVAFLRANTDQFTAKLDEAEAKLDKMSSSGASNFSKLATVGKFALLGIGAAAVGVGVASIDMADKYQGATDQLAANADISIAKANQIGKAFLGTAGTTIYSAQQIMSAYAGVAGQLGATQGHALTTAQAMTVMKAAMDLAEATGESLTASTSDLAGVMQAYGIKANGAAGASNILFNAARTTGTSIDALSGVIEKMHSKLGAAAPSLSDTGALLVDLAHHGETGRAALAAVSSGMQTMLKSATSVTSAQTALTTATDALPPSLQNLAQQYSAGTLTGSQLSAATKTMTIAQSDAWKQFTKTSDAAKSSQTAYNNLGIDVVNAQGKFVGIKSVIQQLGPALQGMTSIQQTAALTQVFGASAASKLQATIAAGPAAFDAAAAAVSRSNSVHEAAEKQAQNLQHQVELVKATVEDYGVKIGQALIPKLEAMLKAGLAVSQWLLKHKDVLIAVAAVITGVVATAIGAYVILTGVKMVKSTIEAGKAVVGLGKALISGASSIAQTATQWASSLAKMAASAVKWAAENIAKVATVVATNVAAAASTAAAWIAANAAMILATGGIILAIGALILIVVEIVKHWGAVKEFFKKLWDDVKRIFDDAWGAIKSVIKIAWDAIKVYFEDFTIVGLILTHWEQIESDAKAVWNDIVSFFTTIPAKIINALSALGSDLLHWITEAWNKFKSWIETAWDNEVDFWKAIPAKIINAVSSFGGLILNWIMTAWNTFKSWIESAWNNEVAFWTTIPQKLISSVVGFAGQFVAWIVAAWNSFNNAVINAFNGVLSWFGGIAGRILSVLGDAASWLYNVGKNIIQGIINGLSDAEQFVLNKIKSIGNDITGAFKAVLGISSPSTVFFEHGRNIMQGLANGITASSGLATSAISQIAGQISGQSFGATGSFNAGISPLTGGTSAAAGGSSQPVYLQINGQTFATLMLPALQTAVLQAQRGSSVPVFGTPQ